MAYRWEDFWVLLLYICVITATSIGFTAIAKPHNVDYYYLSRSTGNVDTATCVYAHWTWHLDEKAFCTNNINEALDFVTKANAAVKH